MKITTRAEKMLQRIDKITQDTSRIISSWDYNNYSVQAELRLSVAWVIRYPVDRIHYPRDLSKSSPAPYPWPAANAITGDIADIAQLDRGSARTDQPINARTKSGPQRRAEAEAEFIVQAGQQFLAAIKKATGKRNLARIRKQIGELQAEQKRLIPLMRKSNSEYLKVKKREREEQAQRNAEALESGRFWDADTNTLKNYFHPPFSKNYLADVSERWRAALFLECQSISYQTYSGNWGHKLGGTGRGYLCGVDDNGDEWGYICEAPQSRDDYFYDAKLDTTVAEAMAEIFGITTTSQLEQCTRQGDLLFCPCKIPTEPGPEMTPQEKWHVRESHEIWSPRLERNGHYLRSSHDIVVSHTSHKTVVLPAGEYRLYIAEPPEGVEAD